MPTFHNILVGVDLTRSTQTGAAALDPIAENAVRQAVWARAQASGAPLTFLTAVAPHGDRRPGVWRLSPDLEPNAETSSSTIAEQAVRLCLVGLVRAARGQGVAAGAVVVAGDAWSEIVREVLHNKQDLVVVGTHDPRGLRRLLLGSTARKLLHECPCPVWVSKPGPESAPRNILVASDLSPLSESVVHVGLGVGRLAGVCTHILDVVEYPLDRLWSPSLADPASMKYHDRMRRKAGEALRAQIERNGCDAADPMVAIHIADGDGLPDHAIVKFIHTHPIDLLVLGTAARHGLSGVFLGNTAERVLTHVPCSVLTVKPADFHCPFDALQN